MRTEEHTEVGYVGKLVDLLLGGRDTGGGCFEG